MIALIGIITLELTGINGTDHSALAQEAVGGDLNSPANALANVGRKNSDWRAVAALDEPLPQRSEALPRSGQQVAGPANPLLTPPPLANISKIATGSAHTCALTTAGAVKCWGYNFFGQLGNNDALNTGAPVNVVGLDSGVIAITAGGFHTCALTNLGAIKCWGYNVYGQLGNSTDVSSTVPVDVSGLGSGVTAISAGRYHTCARTNGGVAKCWGYNAYGQLGNGANISSSTPVNVSGLNGGVNSLSAGAYHACAMTNNGAVKCWGYNTFGQLGDNSIINSNVPVDVFGLSSNMSQVSAGAYHTCVRSSLGAVKCWGYNFYGQLGNNSTANSSVPADVIGLSSGITAIAPGDYHGCALTSAGALKCWGNNAQGQLGNNSTVNRNTPADVSGLGSGVIEAAAGGSHTCAVLSGGTVQCWGYNAFGQLGDGWPASSPLPVNVSGLGNASAIATGASHTCALVGTGALKCWGYNGNGQLGNGALFNSPTPVDVSGFSNNVSAITAGGFHTCGLTNLGAAKCWGRNTEGQLGDGMTTTNPLPVDVSGLGSGVQAIAAGGYHTCAVAGGGATKCWGYNASGELGNTSFTNSNAPVDVAGLGSGVTGVTLGAFHTCALTNSGAVKCWGNNTYGQLGNNSFLDSNVPVDVSGLGSGVQAIAANGYESCVLTTTGEVKCWGYNGFGELGTTTIMSSSVPIIVNGLSGTTSAITVGDFHACALSNAGAVQCWGINDSGQLGSSSPLSSAVPLTVPGLGNGISAIAAGSSHNCARTSNGAIRCWGDGNVGQLGDGNAWKTTPVNVLSSSNPPSGPSQLFLPILLDGYPIYFEGPSEQEPNDAPATANGPIRLNAVYTGHANDQSDYFYFNLTKSTTIAINLTGHNAENAKCNQQPCLQVHLRDSLNTLLSYDFQAPYQIISPSLPAGLYYVRIFDASNGIYDSSNLYSLSVSTP